MLWLILSLVTAFFESLRDVANKTSSTLHNDYVITWSLNAFTALLLLPLTLILGTPTISPPFWNALLAGSFLNAIAFLYFIKAIRLSDLSKVAPLTTFTPLFLLLTSPILVGEFPNTWGLLGILLIVSGAYLLNFAQHKQGYLQPLRALINERGARFMLLVAFLWSLTSNFDKIGVQNSSPLFWVTTVYAANALWLFPLMLLKCQGWREQIQAKPLPLLAIGGFNAIAVACQMTALSLTLVAYVIAIKRTSALFNVLWGRFIFQETGLKQRFLGTGIMVVGVVVIALS